MHSNDKDTQLIWEAYDISKREKDRLARAGMGPEITVTSYDNWLEDTTGNVAPGELHPSWYDGTSDDTPGEHPFVDMYEDETEHTTVVVFDNSRNNDIKMIVFYNDSINTGTTQRYQSSGEFGPVQVLEGAIGGLKGTSWLEAATPMSMSEIDSYIEQMKNDTDLLKRLSDEKGQFDDMRRQERDEFRASQMDPYN